VGKTYDQLDIDQRYEIHRPRRADMSLRGIGRMMGRSLSTIGREVKQKAIPRAT
jgi:IS30 family transposase